MIIQTAPIFQQKSNGTAKKRKAAICYALAADDANDVYTYARKRNKTDWKQIKLPLLCE